MISIRKKLFALPLGVALASVGGMTASASTVDVSDVLKDFNAVIFTNASAMSDIEGAAVVGGNFQGATVYSHPTPGQTQPAGYGALTVFGATSGNPINLNNGGNAYVGGAKNALVNFNGGGHYLASAPAAAIDFSALTSLSSHLATLSATSVLPTTGNNENIVATPGSDGVAVFNITAAQLDAIPSYKMVLNGAATVIFNVSGSTINFAGNDETGVTGASNIIWNFYDASTVNLETQIAGAILAPEAAVTNGNQIDGDLIAKSWTGNGELHDWGFDGPLPPGVATGVPEPSTWAMTLAGFAALGFVAFRQKRDRAAKGATA